MTTSELIMIPLGIVLFELGLALVIAFGIKMFFNELYGFVEHLFGSVTDFLFKPKDLMRVKITTTILGGDDDD